MSHATAEIVGPALGMVGVFVMLAACLPLVGRVLDVARERITTLAPVYPSLPSLTTLRGWHVPTERVTRSAYSDPASPAQSSGCTSLDRARPRPASTLGASHHPTREESRSMSTDAPTPATTTETELPRPATFDQAIRALTMASGKHPRNRVLPELRERQDGGALRSGDLKAFAAILELWRDSAPTEPEIEPAQIDAEPRTDPPGGNGVGPARSCSCGLIDTSSGSTGHTQVEIGLRDPACPFHGEATAPSIELLERVRAGIVAWADPFVGPAAIDAPDLWFGDGDPFVGPAPILVTTEGAIELPAEWSALANPDADPVAVPPDEPDPPTTAAAGEGGEPLPKGGPGVAPGAMSYAAAPLASAPAPVATAPDADPFSVPRQYVTHRSPSQVMSYHECGVRYRLERVEHTADVPAWWNIGGTAFHETMRWWEFERALSNVTHSPDETARKFELAFSDELARVTLANPNVGTSLYRAANKGSEGRDWWRDHGATMAADYVTGQEDRDTQVLRLSPDVLALELGFVVSIGGIDVKGFIDQVLVYPNGDALVRDYKTGSRLPDDPLQLQIYAIALRRLFGIERPIWGAYWRARRTTKREPGQTTPTRIDIDETEPVVAWRVREMDRAERSGVYPARPSSFCGSCGVRAQCPVMGPPDTRRLDLLTAS